MASSAEKIRERFPWIIVALAIAVLHSIPCYATEDLSEVVDRIRPAVVRVTNRVTTGRAVGRLDRTLSVGCGVVIDPAGIILTGLVDEPGELTVEFDNGRKVLAKWLASDRLFQLAVLKVERSDLPIIRVADERPKVGQQAIAAGFASHPGSLKPVFAVSAGVISSDRFQLVHSRTMPGYFLATDIRGDPGMSLLFNGAGELVSVMGIVHMPRHGELPSWPGCSFYPLTDIPERILDELQRGITPKHGRLGLQVQSIDWEMVQELGLSQTTGAIVQDVQLKSVEEEGLQRGDVILQFDDAPVRGPEDLRRMAFSTAPGTSVRLLIYRKLEGTIPIEITVRTFVEDYHTMVAGGGRSVEARKMVWIR